jgi:hypothetical protein
MQAVEAKNSRRSAGAITMSLWRWFFMIIRLLKIELAGSTPEDAQGVVQAIYRAGAFIHFMSMSFLLGLILRIGVESGRCQRDADRQLQERLWGVAWVDRDSTTTYG